MRQEQVLDQIRNAKWYSDIEFRTDGIRVGNWQQMPSYLLKIVDEIIKVEEDAEYDDDRGWLYFYSFLDKEEQRIESFNYQVQLELNLEY